MRIISISLLIAILICPSISFAKESEDNLIVTALFLEVNNPYDASIIWKRLFQDTKKEEYLKEYFNTSLKYKSIKEVIKELKEAVKHTQNRDLYNLLASLYIQKGNTKSAIDLLSQDISKLDIDTLYELAYLYNLNNLDNKALKIYKIIYNKTKSWNALKGILSILAKQNNRGEVIDRLWSEININDKLPNKAILIFIGLLDVKKDANRAIYAYNKLYKRTKNKEYLKQIISIYLYKKDNKNLIKLLEETGYDNELLYELYVTNNSLVKAYKLTQKLINTTKKPKYIAEQAILTYEIASKYKAVDTKVINEVRKLFKTAYDKGLDDDIYYNYFGYILINNNQVEEGLKYINKALSKDPNNIYYLDSLAWGNYKLKRCKEAKNIVDRMENIDKINEKDILNHIKEINSCSIQTVSTNIK